jgi:hypothetical protein
LIELTSQLQVSPSGLSYNYLHFAINAATFGSELCDRLLFAALIADSVAGSNAFHPTADDFVPLSLS